MATFGDLQNSVASQVIDLPTPVQTAVPELIQQAVRNLQTLHGFKVCEALSSILVTSVGSRILTPPTDFYRHRGVPHLIDKSGRVRDLGLSLDRAAVERDYGTNAGGEAVLASLQGSPKVILETEPTDGLGAFNLEVYPIPDGLSGYANGEYRIRVPYWKFLPRLANNSSTNWFTMNAEEYIIAQAAHRAFLLDWDEERSGVQAQIAAGELKKIILRDKYARISGTQELRPSWNARGSRVNRGDN